MQFKEEQLRGHRELTLELFAFIANDFSLFKLINF